MKDGPVRNASANVNSAEKRKKSFFFLFLFRIDPAAVKKVLNGMKTFDSSDDTCIGIQHQDYRARGERI